MMKLQWKQAVIAGAVLTAFCANALAAETSAPTKPTMRERVNCILDKDNNICPPDGPRFDGGRRGPATHHRNAEFLKHHHHGISNEDWDAKTPEEKRQLREEWIKEWNAKTPEERKELRDKWHQERLERMTPEQRERYEKRRAEAERLRNLSPEERSEELRKIREERRAARSATTQENLEKLSPEQIAEVEAFLKEDMERRAQMRNRFENMTPEQKEVIRDNRGPGARLYHGGHHGYRNHRQDREHCWY